MLNQVKAAKPDVLEVAAAVLDDRRVYPPNEGAGPERQDVRHSCAAAFPDYYQGLGNLAEYVYSSSPSEPGLPYPGNQGFVTAYAQEFTRAPALQSASATRAASSSWMRYDGRESGL